MRLTACLAGWLVFAATSHSIGQELTTGPAGFETRFSAAPPPSAVRKGPFPGGTFVLEADDSVVFVGSASVVGSQWNGQLEALLALAYPQHPVRFRNLAWEGDTVFEQPRELNFGSWSQQLDYVGATVVFAEFGRLEVLAAMTQTDSVDQSVEEFATAYETLLDQFAARTQRIVIVTPPPFESPPSQLLPDLSQLNSVLEQYTVAMQGLAQRRKFVFVDTFHALHGVERPTPLTVDGLQLTFAGQTGRAESIAAQLGLALQTSDTTSELRLAIVHKNRIWFDYWRPRNWAFLWGDRTTQPFSKDWRSERARLFPEEMQQYPRLIAAAEQEIRQQVARLARLTNEPTRND